MRHAPGRDYSRKVARYLPKLAARVGNHCGVDHHDDERSAALAEVVGPNPLVGAEQVADWQGPAVRLVSATENTIQTLVIRVASLDRARRFLRDRQLLGADPEGRPTIDPSKVGGLDFRLVDK